MASPKNPLKNQGPLIPIWWSPTSLRKRMKGFTTISTGIPRPRWGKGMHWRLVWRWLLCNQNGFKRKRMNSQKKSTFELLYLDPPRGVKSMVKGAIKQPLRVQTPPLGGCWYNDVLLILAIWLILFQILHYCIQYLFWYFWVFPLVTYISISIQSVRQKQSTRNHLPSVSCVSWFPGFGT